MIIAVDFDGTLMINKQPNHGLIAMLQDRQMRGDIVILWTLRMDSGQIILIKMRHKGLNS
jgi:hypothetical protein